MKKLTHEESCKRQEAMREYFREGHTAKETAIKFDTTANYVKQICRGIRTGNQYTNGLFDREANAVRYINERTPWFEYAGNFTGIDGYVDLKCKKCGTILRKSFVCVKHGKAKCEECKHKEQEEYRKKKEEERQREQETKRKERERQRILERNNKSKQVVMKVCPVCNNLFVGIGVYCSPHCRNQNKSRMKDGYRYLFPLHEVYKRDNGICYLCGGLCDWNDWEEVNGVIVYGNNYPSRDHVIPKSKGGLNDWSNIRLAHRICNSLKADSPLVKKNA